MCMLRWVFLSACIGAIPLGIIFWDSIPIYHHPSTLAVLLLLFVIIFPSFAAYLLVPPAIKRIGQQLVAMYQNLMPILTTILALIFKTNKLYWDQPIAVVVILLGVYISSKALKKDNNSEPLSAPKK